MRTILLRIISFEKIGTSSEIIEYYSKEGTSTFTFKVDNNDEIGIQIL